MDSRQIVTMERGNLTSKMPCFRGTERSLQRLESWVEGQQYMAYEPFDGLSSPVRVLTFGSLFLDRLLMQAVRQSPWKPPPAFPD